MSGVPVRRAATYQDLKLVPEHLVAEIIDGELVTSPRPSIRHAAVTSALGSNLDGTCGLRGGGGSPGGWVILDEPELHIVGQVLVPDIAGWRRARLPEIPDVAFLELAPDWVCEVLSPATAVVDRTRKMTHYPRAEVHHLWLIDPALETLEIFRLDGDGWRLVSSVAGSVLVNAEPFEAVELDLAQLWAR